MTSHELPGGGKGWFVRKKKGGHCGLVPASREGHLLSAAFVMWVTGVSWFFVERDVDVPMLASWIALILAATFMYILTALRMSASETSSRRRRR